MRTTLDIADDVLAAAEAIAKEWGKTLGEVISDLARQSLRKPMDRRYRNGVPLLEIKDLTTRVTLEMVNALREGSS